HGVITDPNGLYSMRARFYNPYICRFVNADPSGFEGGMNFYTYADGNPISLVDPFGLGTRPVAWSPLGSFAAGFVGGAGLVFDQFYNTAATSYGLAADIVGNVLDMVGQTAFGDPNLGQGFRNLASEAYSAVNPAANAGLYDADSPLAYAASAAS